MDSTTLYTSTEVNKADYWGRRPIYHAIVKDNIGCVQLLLQTGLVDLSLTSKVTGQRQHETPIATALRLKRKSIFNLISNHQQLAPANKAFKYLKTALKSDMLLELLNAVNITDLSGWEMVLCQYAKKDHFRLLYTCQFCFNQQRCLVYFLSLRRYQMFQWMLQQVKQRYNYNLTELINCRFTGAGNTRLTLLAMASVQGYLVGVKRLIALGADPNILVQPAGLDTKAMNCLEYLLNNKNFPLETPHRQSAIIKTAQYLADNIYHCSLPLGLLNRTEQNRTE